MSTTISHQEAYNVYQDVTQGKSLDSWESFVDTKFSNGDLVKIWRLYDSTTKLYKYRVLGTMLKIDFEKFKTFFQDYDFRATWDSYTTKLITLSEKDSSKDIYWRVTWNFPLISDREFLFTRSVESVEGVHVMLDSHLSHHDKDPGKKGVRIDNYSMATVIAPTDNGDIHLYIDYLNVLDMKMSLPSWLLNWAAGSGCKTVVTSYRDNYEKYDKYLEKLAAKSSKQ